MKSAFLVCLFLAQYAFAQTPNHVTLELRSVTVWLGEPKAQVQKEMESEGMIFGEGSGRGHYLVADNAGKTSYPLQFTNDKLSYAARNWMSDDPAKALQTVMDAMTSLVDRGAVKCELEHAPMNDPNMRVNRIFINCGLRGLLLTTGTAKIAGENYGQDEVSEFIGIAL